MKIIFVTTESGGVAVAGIGLGPGQDNASTPCASTPIGYQEMRDCKKESMSK
jgi:hypothetical protein